MGVRHLINIVFGDRNNDFCLFYFIELFSSVHLLSRVRLFAIPWTTARQASLSITNSWSLPKLISIESVMASSHLIFCHPLLLLHTTPPSFRVFSNESTLHMMCTKYWQLWQQSIDSALAPVIPMNTQDLSPLGWTSWIFLQVQGTLKSLLQHHSSKAWFFGTQLSL